MMVLSQQEQTNFFTFKLLTKFGNKNRKALTPLVEHPYSTVDKEEKKGSLQTSALKHTRFCS